MTLHQFTENNDDEMNRNDRAKETMNRALSYVFVLSFGFWVLMFCITAGFRVFLISITAEVWILMFLYYD